MDKSIKKPRKSRLRRTADIRKVNFGFASAEQESNQFPTLLIDGYIDLQDVSRKVFSEHYFLVLGYKGSGKTAIAERLRLLHEADHDTFISYQSLEDFPYTAFSELVRENDAPEAKYPVAWSWILLINVIGSLEKDHSLQFESEAAFRDTVEALKTMRLLPTHGLSGLVTTTTKKSFKLSIPKIFEGTWNIEDNDVDIRSYVESLKELLRSGNTTNKHLLIIDGLDEIITSEAAQWKSLSALIFECNQINTLLLRTGINAKILLLCRTDMFELLAGANKNKIRQDSAIDLNWYADPRSPHTSALIQIANLRATLSLGETVDLLTEFFPKTMFRRSTRQVLLDTTRHTPRDFLQLLKFIQSYCGGPVANRDHIRSGLRKYSVEYFMPEIIDEMDGYATAEEVKELFRLIGFLRRRDFQAKEVKQILEKSRSSLTEDKVDMLFSALFECSALGNVQQKKDGKRFLTFRYRNRHSTFNREERILLHRGLWQSFNLPVDATWGE